MRNKAQQRRDTTAKRKSGQSWQLGFSFVELVLSMMLVMILMGTMVGVFKAVARRAAVEGRADAARADGRLIMKRLGKEVRLVGLVAPLDADGTADDINTDVTGETWTDSVRDNFEFATTHELVFTSDFDNDGITETIKIWLGSLDLHETIWKWSRDSVRWDGPVDRRLAQNVDHILFSYFDRQGNPVPAAGGYGVILTTGERRLVTEVEILLVTRSNFEDRQNLSYCSYPDGTYSYDGYLRFQLNSRIRSRNL